MSSWPLVLVPAACVALTVRLDAKLIGPYFALSDFLIGGTADVSARHWYEQRTLRRAFVRRFLYPIAGGFVLGWLSLSMSDILSVGLLAALLLLWPMLFHGLPWYVPRHSWHLPVLYISFVVAYGAAALAGWSIQGFVMQVSAGDISGWLSEQAVGAGILWVVTGVGADVHRRTFRRASEVALRREQRGAEGDVDATD